MINNIEKRRRLISTAFEGVSLDDLAQELETTRGALYNVKYGRRQVSARRAIDIEKATNGKINRAILRPDIFGE